MRRAWVEKTGRHSRMSWVKSVFIMLVRKNDCSVVRTEKFCPMMIHGRVIVEIGAA